MLIVFSFLSSTGAAATLQQRLGEVQIELHTKKECSKAAQERDRLVKESAGRADRQKAELQMAKDKEAALQDVFETERSGWAEREKSLSDGYGEIEDMLNGKLSFSFLSSADYHMSRLPTSCFFSLHEQSTSPATPSPPAKPSKLATTSEDELE